MDISPPPLPPAQPPRHIRARGWVLIVLGVLLCAGMGYITWLMIGIVNAPTQPGSLPRWHGSHETTVRMFSLFGTIILFGFASLVNGVWCVRHRAFQPVLRVLMLLVAAGIVVAGVLLSNTFK